MGIINTLIEYFPDLLVGSVTTIWLCFFGIIFSLIWGFLVYLVREYKYLRYVGEVYFEFMRNTPLLVQMLFIYFGSGYLDIPIGAFGSALLALTLQHGAFVSELYKAGIKSVPVGNLDASMALGMTDVQSMKLVIFPQAIRNVIPPLSNQVILLVKDTTLASGISVMEVTLTGKVIAERTTNSFVIFLGIAIIYLVINLTISVIMKRFEKRQN